MEGVWQGGTSLGKVRSPSPKGRKPKATVAAFDHLILFSIRSYNVCIFSVLIYQQAISKNSRNIIFLFSRTRLYRLRQFHMDINLMIHSIYIQLE